MFRYERHVLPALGVCTLAIAACGGNGPSTPSSPSTPVQTFHVHGTVRDSGNENLLSGAVVQLGASSRDETEFEGEFTFDVAAGAVILSVTAAGYASHAESLQITGPTALDIRLVRTAARTVRCGDAPDVGTRVLPLFGRPFDGTYPLTNYFDHDRPQPQDGNGVQVTACSDRVPAARRIDGHAGYDWLLPSGTPVLAAEDGQVTFAGTEAPFECLPLGRTVGDQLAVEILHPAVKREQFSSVYVHLSRIAVSAGQQVVRGQVIGLSGNTGCSTEPHLHLQVWRFTNTNTNHPVVSDPYGWDGATADPWAAHPAGTPSIWLWRPGEAPSLVLR